MKRPAKSTTTEPSFGDLLDVAFLRYQASLDAIADKYRNVGEDDEDEEGDEEEDDDEEEEEEEEEDDDEARDPRGHDYKRTEAIPSNQIPSSLTHSSNSDVYSNSRRRPRRTRRSVIVRFADVLERMVGGLMTDVEDEAGEDEDGDEFAGIGKEEGEDEDEGKEEAIVVKLGEGSDEEGEEEDVDLVLTQAVAASGRVDGMGKASQSEGGGLFGARSGYVLTDVEVSADLGSKTNQHRPLTVFFIELVTFLASYGLCTWAVFRRGVGSRKIRPLVLLSFRPSWCVVFPPSCIFPKPSPKFLQVMEHSF